MPGIDVRRTDGTNFPLFFSAFSVATVSAIGVKQGSTDCQWVI
jgi:hypothetical protein